MRKRLFQRFFYRFGTKRTLHDVTVAIWMLSSSEEKALAFDRLEMALGLVKKYAPAVFTTLQGDLRSILVAGDPTYEGFYIHDLGMVQLDDKFVLDKATTPNDLACYLVHEAQHARLRRLGFGYEAHIRARIERICIRAQRNLARLLPDGEELVAHAEAWMNADLEAHYSTDSFIQRNVDGLKAAGCPDWLVNALAWVANRRSDRRHQKPS